MSSYLDCSWRILTMDLFCPLRKQTLAFLFCILSLIAQIDGIGEVIWAVNAGGEAHSDVNGIRYQKDPLKTGVSSDYGKGLLIQRVPQQDQILYQTERYDQNTFGYDIPIKKDGDYVLVMKFSEVWFTAPNQKVFDIVLNRQHTVVDGLDIYAKVGRGSAHDELVAFTVKAGKLAAGGETSIVEDDKVAIEFVKGDRDNPKLNALYVMRGKPEDVPQLPPLPGFDRREEPEEEEEEVLDDEIRKPKKKRPSSGPKIQDPYAADDTGSMMLPVIVAIGAFLPLVFCLCRL